MINNLLKTENSIYLKNRISLQGNQNIKNI